jgi:acetoin utilization protein AcuB
MSEIPAIGSVMITAPISVDVGEPVRVAQDRMIDHEIRHLPVLDGERLVGIVSDRDMSRLESDPAWERRAESLLVRDVCTVDFYAVDPDTPLDEVLMEMAQRRIGSVIVARGGQIVGLFTMTDACRCFAEHLRGKSAGSG